MTAPVEELVDAVIEVVRAFREGRQLTPAVAGLANVWEKHPRELLSQATAASKGPREAQLMFREALRQLCLSFNQGLGAGQHTTQAAQIVAEETMHMAAFFVANGSQWDADKFAAECKKMFEFHKKNPPPRQTSNLN